VPPTRWNDVARRLFASSASASSSAQRGASTGREGRLGLRWSDKLKAEGPMGSDPAAQGAAPGRSRRSAHYWTPSDVCYGPLQRRCCIAGGLAD
jgi:hypothetical protein